MTLRVNITGADLSKAPPDVNAIIQQAEQQYGLPPGLLAAHRQVESSGGVNLHSGQADGSMQITPANAKAAGIDPMDDAQAIPWAAKTIRSNIDASGGDLDRASMMYFGGPDPSNWGPKTRAYPGKIAAALSRQSQSASSTSPDEPGAAFDGDAPGNPFTGSRGAAPRPTHAGPDAPGNPFTGSRNGPLQPDMSDSFEAAVAGKAPAEAPQAPDNPFRSHSPAGRNPSVSVIPEAPDNPFRTKQSPRAPIDMSDPFEAAVAGVTSANASQAPTGNIGRGMGTAGSGRVGTAQSAGMGAIPGGAVGVGIGASGEQPGGGGAVGPIGGQQGNPLAGARGANPAAASQEMGWRGAIHGLSDEALGVGNGILNGVLGGATELIGHGTDALGLTSGGAARVAERRKALAAFMASHQYDPGGAADTVGNISGQIIGTSPLGAVGLLGKLGPVADAAGQVTNAAATGAKASMYARLFNAGGRIGDAAIGGAAGNVLTGSPGSNVGDNATMGAMIGAGVGMVSPVVGRIVGATTSKAQQLAQHLRKAGPVAEDAAGNVAQQAAPSPQDIAGAFRNGGATRSIGGNTKIPDSVLAHVSHLQRQGVPLDHAIREAEATYVGAKPLAANVTRDFGDMQATAEGAKAATPEGRSLQGQMVANNAALHDTTQRTVAGYGGVPAQGEASASAAKSLADAADASRAKVSDLYRAADTAAGDMPAKAEPVALRQLLADPATRTAVTGEGRALVGGMTKRLALLSSNGNLPLDAGSLELLRKAANDAYSVTGGEVNGIGGKMKAAIDDAFDSLGNSPEYRAARAAKALGLPTDREAALLQQLKAARASKGIGMDGDEADAIIAKTAKELGRPIPADATAAYKAARAAHAEHMAAFDQPGVSDLIARDAKGNFLNDPYKAGASILADKDPRRLGNIVDRLKSIGDTDSVNKIKAEVVQSAYEKATKAVGDSEGNAPFSGKLFHDGLDAFGMAKLDKLFTPREIGHLATIGRAARTLNDVSRGAENTSHSASALTNALNAHGTSAAKELGIQALIAPIAQGVGHAIVPGFGGVAIGAGMNVAAATGRAATAARRAKAMGAAMRAAGSPSEARALQSAADKQNAAHARAVALGHMFARNGAPALAAAHRNGREIDTLGRISAPAGTIRDGHGTR